MFVAEAAVRRETWIASRCDRLMRLSLSDHRVVLPLQCTRETMPVFSMMR
jgi:hypothetical protein